MEQKNYDLAVALRHELHRHPELSLQEDWTVKHLEEFLRQHTSLEIRDRGHWFYAVYHAKNPRGSIGFRADIDALPIDEAPDLVPYSSQVPHTSHKCGHDGHAASMAAFALEISQKGCDKDVYFLFQHAEEIGAGAIECTAMLKENQVDEIFGYHNRPGMKLGVFETMPGTYYCASKGMTIHFVGTPSHASMPEVGKNPAFAIADIIHAIPAIIKPEEYTGLVLCTIIQVDVGEPTFGTQAHKGNLLLTIRGEHEAEMDDLQAKLEKLSCSKAEEYGLSCSFSYCDYFPETANTPEKVEKVRQICEKNGWDFHMQTVPYRGSEDFGHLTKVVPGVIFEVGGGEGGPQLHTSAFDFNDKIIPYAVDMYWELVRA